MGKVARHASKSTEAGGVKRNAPSPKTALFQGENSSAKPWGSSIEQKLAALIAQVEQALEEGSPAFRTEAISLLARLDPALAERRACERFRRDEDQGVRRACVRALAHGETDAGHEVLLAALTRGELTRFAAMTSLRTFRHRLVAEKVFARLEDELIGSMPPPVSTPKNKNTSARGPKVPQETPAKTSSSEATETDLEKKANRIETLLRVLAVRHTDKMMETVATMWRSHPDIRVQIAAGKCLLEANEQAGLQVLVERLSDEDDSIGILAGTGFAALDPETFLERARPYLSSSSLQDPAQYRCAKNLMGSCTGGFEVGGERTWDIPLPKLEPGWFEIAVDAIREHTFEFCAYVIFERLDDPRTFDALKGYFPSIPFLYTHLPGLLTRAGGVRAIPELLKLFDQPKGIEDVAFQGSLLRSLRELGDRSVVPALKKLAKKAPEELKESFAETLAALQGK